MNKKIILTLIIAVMLFTPACKDRAQTGTEPTYATENEISYSDLFASCDIGNLTPVTHFSLSIDGADSESELSLSYRISKSDNGYTAEGEDGKNFGCEGDMTADFMKKACYLPPCDCLPAVESSDGVTVYSFSPEADAYREMLLSCSPFFDGYEKLPSENAVISNVIYTAHASAGVLTDYEYSYDISVNDDGFAFVAHVSVKINI